MWRNNGLHPLMTPFCCCYCIIRSSCIVTSRFSGGNLSVDACLRIVLIAWIFPNKHVTKYKPYSGVTVGQNPLATGSKVPIISLVTFNIANLWFQLCKCLNKGVKGTSMLCYLYIFVNIQVKAVFLFYVYKISYLGQFWAFHKEWYSTLVEGLEKQKNVKQIGSYVLKMVKWLTDIRHWYLIIEF